MAKRFLDTSFFKSPFVRGLKGAYKGLYLFIICDCEGSGIWSADFEAASLYVGQTVDKAGFEKFFVQAGKAIDLENGRYFLPDFIEHQYPGGLSNSNIAHKNFIIELTKYQLLDENLKPLQSPFKGSKVMVMAKEKVVVSVKENDFGEFSEIVEKWMAYKKARKESYKSNPPIQAFFSKLKTLSNNSIAEAEKIIEQSMANNWAGIFELKTGSGPPQNPNGLTINPRFQSNKPESAAEHQARKLKELEERRHGINSQNSQPIDIGYSEA